MTATQTLVSLLPPERVQVGLLASSKADLLEQMSTLATRGETDVDSALVLSAVLDRERLISTGVGQGLALPHARSGALQQTIAALATLVAPVEYDSLDGLPVRLVLLLAGPESERNAHLRLLSRISRVMANAATRQRLLGAESVRDVLRTLADAEDALG